MNRFLTWLFGILFVLSIIKAYWWDRLPKEEPEQTIIRYQSYSPSEFHTRLCEKAYTGR